MYVLGNCTLSETKHREKAGGSSGGDPPAKRTGQANGSNERGPVQEPASTSQFARYVCAHELDKT